MLQRFSLSSFYVLCRSFVCTLTIFILMLPSHAMVTSNLDSISPTESQTTSVTENTQSQSPYTVDRLVVRITVNPDGTSSVDRQRLITANTLQGVQAISQFGDRYNQTKETLDVIQAWSKNSAGDVFHIGEQAIRDVDQHNGQGGVFSDAKVRMVIFPNVDVGTQVFLHTLTKTNQPIFPGHFMYEEELDPREHFKDVEIELIHDATQRLYVHAPRMQGQSELSADQRQRIHRYHFEQSNPVALEESMVDWHDVFVGFQVSTLETVQELGQIYAQYAQPQEVMTPEIASLAQQLTQGLEDPLDQVHAIYDWVSSKIRYVGVYLDNANVVPHAASEVLANGYGDCKDHNALFVALLKAKGIDAQAALINQGSSYQLPEIGIPSSLNHVITYLPQWSLFLDTTSGLLPFGVLSDDMMDKPVVLTVSKAVRKTPKATPETNRMRTTIEMRIEEDGVMRGEAFSELQGPNTLGLREFLASYEEETAQDMVRFILNRYLHTGQGRIEFRGAWEREDPMYFRMIYALDPENNYPGPGALSLPLGLSPGGLSSLLTQVVLPHRQFAYQCQPFQLEEHYRIEFPSTVVVTSVPTDVQIEDGSMRFEAHYQQEGNTVVADRKLLVDPQGHVCAPEQTKGAWRLRQQIVHDLRSQIFYQPR